MVATFFLDWGFAFGTGLLFGLAGARAPVERTFTAAAAYLHIGILPIAVGFYLWHPDWMWMYWLEGRALPIAIVVVAFLLYEICLIAGLAVARAAPRALTMTLIGATTLAGLAGAATSRARLLHFGSTDAYRAGRLDAVGTTELTILALAGAGSLALLGVLVHRSARGAAILR